ncbi:leucyl aminopeptidase (aminopeptidase T) [Natranaerovirga hydrolytica]|uniref:Leucyl aminopeptidase (Aminopeptidase T) n=1 Tax=Natranaerovirga hydrolytica TaxID=680378 RepID=A0A4R1MJP9_9FIRM|nr:aminopeptidase [Natranaerovirga hydrolytica]TCK90539.1 leucyl aminopeptidase (aminopeptidase T) [Natranaerovirga hydrolytica]
MAFKDIIKKDNEKIIEQYETMIQNIKDLNDQTNNPKNNHEKYLNFVSDFLINLTEEERLMDEHYFKNQSIEAIQSKNEKLYQDIINDEYNKSYANPSYSVELFGETLGQVLAFVYTELRGCIADVFEHRLYDLTLYGELFLKIANDIQDSHTIKGILKDFYEENLSYFIERNVNDRFNTDYGFATEIIMNNDLEDLRYLYQFGEYIGHNELKIAQYLNQLPQEKINLMASTYTQAYKKGFERDGIDLSKKKTVNIRYSIGFERVVKEAIRQFKQMDLEPIIFRYAVKSINKKQHLKVGYFATSPNKQYDYDHRFDEALYLDEDFANLKIKLTQEILEKHKDKLKNLAGPAVIEVFGEKPFKPISKKEAIALTQEQKTLKTSLNNTLQSINYQYMPGDEWSFTIIAFPMPEIGNAFEDIFDDVIKVNTLDSDLYTDIQQNIIDALDQGEYVEVKGKNENKTNIKVNLQDILNPKKETKFENCVADVNVPVGEVFTSPRLKGTNGILHVKEVYLRDLKYENLTLEFEDGYIKEYTCTNFKNEEDNKGYIKENLMYNYDTLPIGEFAIGTNTTAYVMAMKYNILNILPILIVEKMGPHFAVGDTCYSRSEDLPSINPNGKEVIPRDNEKSLTRKTNPEEAYYNCHTDITIPYDEIERISVVTKEGSRMDIIKDTKFVLTGTEKLNEAFK